MNKSFDEIYLNILQENINCCKNNKAKVKKITIDNFCDENTTDIAESGDDTDQNFWEKGVIDNLSGILDDCNNLQYELGNCEKGANTNCKTTSELSEYVRQLAERLNTASKNISNI